MASKAHSYLHVTQVEQLHQVKHYFTAESARYSFGGVIFLKKKKGIKRILKNGQNQI